VGGRDREVQDDIHFGIRQEVCDRRRGDALGRLDHGGAGRDAIRRHDLDRIEPAGGVEVLPGDRPQPIIPILTGRPTAAPAQ
jgi:hypothetical protein